MLKHKGGESMWFLVQFDNRQDEFIKANNRGDLDMFIKRRINSSRSGLEQKPASIEETPYSDSDIVSEDHSPLHHQGQPWRAINPVADDPVQYESRCNMGGHNSLYFGRYPDLSA